MGRRGPNAKPAKKKQPTTAGAATRPWAKKGLSRAQRVIAFVESLQVTSGVHAGKPFRVRPWQKKIIRALYRTKNRRRVVRQALISTPRKNGKTGLAAALALCHLAGPEAVPRGQVYSAAADREQAAIIFREMVAMIDVHPDLSERVNIKSFTRELEDDESGSTYKALSADARTKHGLSASCVIYDELAQAPNRNLYDTLNTSTAAWSEPLMVTISTQSPDPNSVMSELVDYGRQVNDGTVDDETFHGTIFSAPEDADPWDESVWYECNPALGDFRSLEEMRVAAAQAQKIPARESAFRNLYLNQPTDPDVRYISAQDWEACKAHIDPDALRGRPCFGGLDLSANRDLTALVLYFPFDGGSVIPFFWCPGDRLDQREEYDKVPYRTWARQGLIEATPGRAVDKRAIALRLADIAATYDVQGIAFDRWGMDELNRILDEEGIELPLVEYGQGFKDMSPAVAALETVVLQGELQHDGNALLSWCLSNVAIDQDPAGNRKASKSKARDRIDGAVALMQAVGLYAKQRPAVTYDFDRDLILS